MPHVLRGRMVYPVDQRGHKGLFTGHTLFDLTVYEQLKHL